jgi:hypothetical protein
MYLDGKQILRLCLKIPDSHIVQVFNAIKKQLKSFIIYHYFKL